MNFYPFVEFSADAEAETTETDFRDFVAFFAMACAEYLRIWVDYVEKLRLVLGGIFWIFNKQKNKNRTAAFQKWTASDQLDSSILGYFEDLNDI